MTDDRRPTTEHRRPAPAARRPPTDELCPATDDRYPLAMPPLRLDMPVKFLKGIGERRAEALQKLGISTAPDLLWPLPPRHVDASAVTPLIKASVGADVACVGRVV